MLRVTPPFLPPLPRHLPLTPGSPYPFPCRGQPTTVEWRSKQTARRVERPPWVHEPVGHTPEGYRETARQSLTSHTARSEGCTREGRHGTRVPLRVPDDRDPSRLRPTLGNHAFVSHQDKPGAFLHESPSGRISAYAAPPCPSALGLRRLTTDKGDMRRATKDPKDTQTNILPPPRFQHKGDSLRTALRQRAFREAGLPRDSPEAPAVSHQRDTQGGGVCLFLAPLPATASRDRTKPLAPPHRGHPRGLRVP